MLADLNELLTDQDLPADICIIGSGPAGMTIAREFVGSGETVVLLEGGGKTVEPISQAIYASRVVGNPHLGIASGRARAFGGTSLLWAGQALPLMAADFEKRDWVAFSGWPFQMNALEPFYRRAESVMGIPRTNYNLESWPTCEPPSFEPTLLEAAFSQFAPVPNFATQHGSKLAEAGNISIFLHANVTSLQANDGANRINIVRAVSFNGRRLSVKPKFVVVCCGGIESARLLLASDSVEKHGIGNRNDVVGRFFQDHPHVSIPVKPRDLNRFRAWCHSIRKSGIRFSFKMVASREYQRAKRITNVGAEVFYPVCGEDPLGAAKTVLSLLRKGQFRPEMVPMLRAIANNPSRVAAAAYRYYVKNQPASVGSGLPHLGIYCEQEPSPNSRITLGTETDALGTRRSVLDWRLTGSESRAARSLAELIRSEWARLGIGDVDTGELDNSLTDPTMSFKDINHHIGATRMGADPRTSVIDETCRVHGYSNLFIGSSASFPTGGFSNPTLTVIALCIRIADDIRKNLQKARPPAANKSAPEEN